MYSTDHPDELKFSRPGKEKDSATVTKAEAAWADVLLGEAYHEYMLKRLPSAATMAALKNMNAPLEVRDMGRRVDGLISPPKQ